jgi:hypothetical protein
MVGKGHGMNQISEIDYSLSSFFYFLVTFLAQVLFGGLQECGTLIRSSSMRVMLYNEAVLCCFSS